MCLSFLAGIFNEPVLQPILDSMAAAALPAIKFYTSPVEQLLGDGFQFARKSKHTNVGRAMRSDPKNGVRQETACYISA